MQHSSDHPIADGMALWILLMLVLMAPWVMTLS